MAVATTPNSEQQSGLHLWEATLNALRKNPVFSGLSEGCFVPQIPALAQISRIGLYTQSPARSPQISPGHNTPSSSSRLSSTLAGTSPDLLRLLGSPRNLLAVDQKNFLLFALTATMKLHVISLLSPEKSVR